MVSIVVLGLAAVALLTVVGLAVLAPLRHVHRMVLLPAAPLLGAALVAVVLSTTSWWLSASWGLLVVGVVAAALVALGTVRGRRPWRFDGPAVLVAVGVLALGAVGAVVALVPNLWVDDGRVVASNDSSDAYFYTAETAWLTDRPFSPVPNPGTVPGGGTVGVTPADAPMRSALQLPLRIGQPLVQAAIGAAVRQDAVHTVMVVAALWVGLAAPAAFVAGRLLRLRRGACWLVAAVSATSAVLVQQVYQQNFDSLLGVGLAVLATAAAVAAAARRIPVWPAALLLAALASVYTEYALYVVPAVLAGAVLVRPWRRWGARSLRLLVVVGVAVVLTPTTWVRGVGALLIPRSGDAFGSPFFSDGWIASAARVVGTVALGQEAPAFDTVRGVLTTAVLFVVLVGGWLLAVVLDRYRAMWSALLMVGLGYVGFLTHEHRGYTQFRAVGLLLPLLVLATGAGWSALVGRLRAAQGLGEGARSRVRTGLALVVSAGLVATTAVAVVVNVRTAPRALDRGFAASRLVDGTYPQAAGWVARHGSPDGHDVTVLAPDLHTQMWLAFSLRDAPLTAYPALRPDYLGTTSYWGGESDPLVLLGPGATRDLDPGTVLERNDRFTLVDLRRGDAVVATPLDLPLWYPRVLADGTMVGPDLGRFAVLRSPDLDGAVDVDLSVDPRIEGTPVAVTVTETGETTLGVVTAGAVHVRVDLGALRVATVVVDLGDDGTMGTHQFALRGVSRAG